MAPYADAHHRLKTPRAAALAGILFSVLLLIALDLLMESVQIGLDDPGVWLASDARKVGVAVNLMPFAGVAFLWFVGVMRDRLGDAEDRLFATLVQSPRGPPAPWAKPPAPTAGAGRANPDLRILV